MVMTGDGLLLFYPQKTYISFGPTHDLKGSPNVSLRSSRVATICHDAFKG